MHRPQRIRKKNKRYQSGGESDEEIENCPPIESALRTVSTKKMRIGEAHPFFNLPRTLALDALETETPSPKEKTSHTKDLSPETKSPDQLVQADDTDVVMGEALWERPPGIGNPGQIKWVLLENFMCHEHFKMEFVPNINFISGQNGSGKSALLQACQQVLGVSARETGRASSQTAFIRTGAHEAKIVIALWNEGPDAYRAREFGKEVIIERIIGKTSSWALKSARGIKIGKRRADLDDLLSYFSIDGSNPISVMTQDVTRSFLAGSTDKSDKQKYAIYQQATMLDQVKLVNDISQSKVDEMLQSIEEAKAKLSQVKKDRDAAKKDLDLMIQVDEKRAEAAALEKVLAWASVRAMEQQKEFLKEKLTAGPPLIEKTGADLIEAQVLVETLSETLQKEASLMDTYSSSANQLSTEIAELKKAHATTLKDVKEATKKIESLELNLEELNKEHEVMKAEVSKQNTEAGDTKAQEALTQFEDILTELNASVQQHVEQKQQLLTSMRKAEEVLRSAMDRHDDIRREVSRAQREVEELSRKQRLAEQEARECANDRRAMFGGRHVLKFCTAVQQQLHRFHRAPIGPIGYYLTLKDAQWSKVVSGALNANLDFFLVHDRHDLEILKEIARILGVPLPSTKVLRLDLPKHHIPLDCVPPQDKLTILQLLECSDPAYEPSVMNTIVDQAQAEKIVLCNTEKDAREVARHPNCKTAFARGGTCYVYKGGIQTRFPENLQWRAPKLGSNSSDLITNVQAELQDTQDWLKKVTEKEAAANMEVQRSKLAMHAAKAAYNAERDELARAEQMVTDYTSQQRDSLLGGDDHIDLGSLQADLTEVFQKKSEVEQSLFYAKQELRDLQEKEKVAVEAWENAKEKMTRLLASNEDAVNAISQRESAKEEAEARVIDLSGRKEALQEQMQALEVALKKALVDVTQYRSMAEEVCSEDEGRSMEMVLRETYLSAPHGWSLEKFDQLLNNTQSLSKLLDKKLGEIKKAEKEAGGLREEVEARFRALSVQFNEKKNFVQNVITHYRRLKEALDNRKATYEKLSRDAELLVGTLFNKYMARKGHTGSIEIDKENQTLNLKVKITGSKDAEKVKDLKQLSGGERSYTTVCFALAVGEYIQSPFRAMDEFDVFMDAVNRRISMVSLFENAMLHKEVQFLLLTPQDVSAVEEAKRHLAEELNNPVPDGFLKVLCMPAARPTGHLAS
eukprot:jgi/Botrbrau1/13682/Bobra.0378s0013.1